MKFVRVRRTRRQFIRDVAAGAMVVESMPLAMGGWVDVPSAPRGIPAVSFFLDQPYWDPTGLQAPYRPPFGTRSGQALGELSDAELRNACGWL